MPDRKELLQDFYAKYAPDQELTDERLNAINTKYGDDNKKLLSDFYAKYAPEQELSDERYFAIENKYNLKKKEPTIPPLGQAFKLGGESTPLLPLTSQSRLGEKPKEPLINPKVQTKTDLLGKTKVNENVKTYSPFTSTIEELAEYFYNESIGKITQNMLDKNTRYNYLKTKKEAYDRGYSDDKSLNGKTAEQKYFDDRETYLVDKYLDQNDKEEVQSLAKFKDLRRLGKEKEANVELEKYLNARSAYRKSIDDQIVEIKATLPNITDPTERTLAERDIQELEILKKPVYNPEQALVDFNKENSNEISNVSKPSESPKEKLRKYTNALYTSVLSRREKLGLTDDMNGLQRFMAERDILSNFEGEAFTQKKQDLDELHADELKLRNATKIYELNRTPYEKDNALGVFAKSFQNEIIPYKTGVKGVDNVIAGNIQTIINDAEIVNSATKEQLALAKQYDKKYEFLSPKWAAQTIAPTAAIIYEMIPAAIATEGIAAISGLGKLNKAINLLAEEGKLTEAGAAYFNGIQNYKIGRGLLKASASGVKYGIESQALSILAPQIKDEMGFASGLFAGGVGSALGSLTGKALEGSIKSIARLFGNKSTDAIRAIESYGTMIAKAKDFSNKVVGETAEEYLEQLAGIYKQSENYNNFITELRKHYETTDAIEEFATIFIMSVGAPAGSTLGRGLIQSGTKLYNNLNKAERKIADEIADELHTEERTAQSDAINSVVPTQNQVTQEDLIITPQAPQEITTEPTSTEGVEAIPISEKTQKRIDELEAQRDKEIENYKVLFTDNPSEEEKAKRIAEAKQEIADDYNSQIETIKQKADERATKRATKGVEAVSIEEQQAIDEAIPNLAEPLKKEIKGLTTIENLMSEGVLEYVDEQTGEPCMKHGIKGNSFKRGSKWEIVKDLKGYKTHEQGGVDLTIGSDGIKIKNGKTDYYAKNGLLMPNN